jgi:hypothetical protein
MSLPQASASRRSFGDVCWRVVFCVPVGLTQWCGGFEKCCVDGGDPGRERSFGNMVYRQGFARKANPDWGRAPEGDRCFGLEGGVILGPWQR